MKYTCGLRSYFIHISAALKASFGVDGRPSFSAWSGQPVSHPMLRVVSGRYFAMIFAVSSVNRHGLMFSTEISVVLNWETSLRRFLRASTFAWGALGSVRGWG